MIKTKLFVITAVTLAALSNAIAQGVPDAVGASNGELKWQGSINEACNLYGFVDGTVVANINQTIMSSTLSGGAQAKVDVRLNADGYKLVFGTAKIYDQNNTEHTDVDTAITPVGSGRLLNGTPIGNFGATNGDLVLTNGGFYQAVVDGSATKRNGAAFPAGSYILRVPVTCVKS